MNGSLRMGTAYEDNHVPYSAHQRTSTEEMDKMFLPLTASPFPQSPTSNPMSSTAKYVEWQGRKLCMCSNLWSSSSWLLPLLFFFFF